MSEAPLRLGILGAARMLTESGEPPAELRRRVTSPGGTTQAGLDVLDAMQADSKISLAALRVDGGACANDLLMLEC